MNERQTVEWLRRRAKVLASSGIVTGIGDDCAIFRPRSSKEELLFTTDLMVAGVHFRAGERPAAVGIRALSRCLSDIAAMGGEPRFCLTSLVLPKANRDQWVKGFYSGFLPLAHKHGMTLAGGDLSSGPVPMCDVIVCGSVPPGAALRRDGARVEDRIFVSGTLGAAAASGYTTSISPRLALGKWLRGRATACIDLSDGLAIDLARLCSSSGVAADLHFVPVAPGATLEQALHGGEDYELLFTMPEGMKIRKTGLIEVGRITRGKGGTIRLSGKRLKPLGWDHFTNG